jgi:hypothetical protein
MPKPGPRTTNKYSDEFKSTAVRLSELAGDDDCRAWFDSSPVARIRRTSSRSVAPIKCGWEMSPT